MGGRREKADELVASSRHETIIGLGKGRKEVIVNWVAKYSESVQQL